MKKLVQINSFDSGSTGNIAKQINKTAEEHGFKTFFLFGRYWKNKNKIEGTKIGIQFDCFVHLLFSRCFDTMGLLSHLTTYKLIKNLKQIKPDIVHIHNIHGYYLNYPMFFKYLRKSKIKVVWTLHDCWSFTGHCSHFDLIKCERWKTGCYSCPLKKEYPKSILFDNSKRNYELKKERFTSIKETLTLVPVSHWLENIVEQSFLRNMNIKVIHNGIDLNVFKPYDDNDVLIKYGIPEKKILLGVASPWSERKGLYDFMKLSKYLSSDYVIVLVGLTVDQIKSLPSNIFGFERTQNAQDLAKLYSSADVFLNLTYEDNYPTVNLESIASGTPVITYKTGGSPESVTNKIGRIVEQGNFEELIEAIYSLDKCDKEELKKQCRKYAEDNFDKNVCFSQYIDLYNNIIK